MVKVHLTSGGTVKIGAGVKDILFASGTDSIKIKSRHGELFLFRWSAVDYVEATDQ